LLDRLYVTKTDVLDVVQRLIQEVGNVRVMERVDNTAAASFADDKPKVTEQTQLMRDRRGLHSDRLGKIVHRAGPLSQPAEDADTARRRQRLHRLGYLDGSRRIDR
jgi:hypothetical protein